MLDDLLIVTRWLAQTKTPPAHVSEAFDRLVALSNAQKSKHHDFTANDLTTSAPKHTGL